MTEKDTNTVIILCIDIKATVLGTVAFFAVPTESSATQVSSVLVCIEICICLHHSGRSLEIPPVLKVQHVVGATTRQYNKWIFSQGHCDDDDRHHHLVRVDR